MFFKKIPPGRLIVVDGFRIQLHVLYFNNM